MTVVSDDFERAALGANWTVPDGTALIFNSSDLGFTATNEAVCLWVANTFGQSQFSQATISANGFEASVGKQVFVRRNVAGARYGFHYRVDVSQWQIKLDGTSPGVVLTINPNVSAPVAGDTIGISVSGSNIRGYKNGVQILTAIDSQLSGSGNGVVMSLALNTTDHICFEDWTGGDYSEVTEFGFVA